MEGSGVEFSDTAYGFDGLQFNHVTEVFFQRQPINTCPPVSDNLAICLLTWGE